GMESKPGRELRECYRARWDHRHSKADAKVTGAYRSGLSILSATAFSRCFINVDQRKRSWTHPRPSRFKFSSASRLVVKRIERVGDDPIDLCRHGTIETTETRFDMCHGNAQLCSNDRARHCGIDVTDHERQLRILFEATLLEPHHDAARSVRHATRSRRPGAHRERECQVRGKKTSDITAYTTLLATTSIRACAQSHLRLQASSLRSVLSDPHWLVSELKVFLMSPPELTPAIQKAARELERWKALRSRSEILVSLILLVKLLVKWLSKLQADESSYDFAFFVNVL